jgi:hypothetical protein
MLVKILLSSAVGLIFFPAAVFACGVYELNGIVRADKSGYRIVTAEGTKSETTFAVSASEAPKLFPYENAPVKASVVISKEIDGTRARIAEVDHVQVRVPDPLSGALDSNYKLKEKRDCAK